KAIEDYKRKGNEIRKLSIEGLFIESPEAQQTRIKYLLNPNNYNAFFQYYFGAGDKYSLTDSDCSKFQINATKELIKHQIITQFRIWFRGSAKSTHTNIGNLFLLKQLQQTKFAVIVGANELRANLLLADIQIHLEYNERIIKDFGMQMSYGDWSKGMFETTDGAYFMALGIDQPFRGLRRFANRVDFASVDDVEDREVANNPRRVRQRSEKILSDLGGAFSKNTKRLVINNNLITNTGIISYLTNKIGDSEYTKISKVNIVDKDGKPTWSERYSDQDVKVERNKTDYYTWCREFMNTPIEEGKIFQEKWIQYTTIPKLQEMDALVLYGDLSYKENGDYKALMLLGKKGRNFYLVDCYVKQSSRSQCAQWLYDTYEDLKLAGYNVHYFIEGLFAQDEFTSDFDLEGDQRGYYIPIVADKNPKSGKYERIESMVGFWERSNIFINEKIKDQTSCKNFITQLLAFEKGSTAHDDAPDAFQSGLSKLNVFTYTDKFDFTTNSIKSFNSKSKHRY
ncbi:MAG: hypothetical protein K2Q03_01205, partial [Sphingobacteriaceae bacterium]|nr:hypothetical protein [Sphingobacteriaceae bacterium]